MSLLKSAPPTIAPSGKQIELVFDEQQAVVVEVGGGLRSYSVDGRNRLDAYGPQELSSSGRGQLLIPWPNRLEDGRYDFGGRTHQLPLSEPKHGNAIHGLVRWSSWVTYGREPHRVLLGHRLHPQPGYPFSLELSVEYSLGEAGLTSRIRATNVGVDPCPYGCGVHPYLTFGTPSIDPLILQVPAKTVLLSDWRGLPASIVPVAGTAFDFRRGRRIGALRLDHAFTELDRGEDGRARIELDDPGGGIGTTLWVDEAFPYVMVFTGDDRPDIARRSLAVEPMSCPPNAFRSGEGVIHLEPGASHTATWGITPAELVG